MEPDRLLSHLEEAARKIGIQVRYEPLEESSSGGLCRLRDLRFIIIDAQAPPGEKVRVLIEALRGEDFSGVSLRPAVRELLEGPEGGF